MNWVCCWWWLRSPGNNSNNVANVNNDGSLNYNGNNVDNDNDCIRPALLPYARKRLQVHKMTDYEKLYSFQNLYRAHTVARRGKRENREVINFEMKLAQKLAEISNALKEHTYTMSGYYHFMVHDPKDRLIHALHYQDRVVQHCLCDEILAPILDSKLIYDKGLQKTQCQSKTLRFLFDIKISIGNMLQN